MNDGFVKLIATACMFVASVANQSSASLRHAPHLDAQAVRAYANAGRPSICGIETGGDASATPQARAGCEGLAPSRKLDEYGDLKPVDENARLEKFVAALTGENEDEDTKAFIIGYAGRRGRAGEALARADRAKDYLVERSVFNNTRINTLDCGHRETPSTELWITRAGAAPPLCSPTVAPGEVQVKGRRRPSSRRRSRAL